MPNGGWQTQVYAALAIGIPGDFANANQFATYSVGAGGLVAGASGVVTGRFAWVVPPLDPDNAPSIANSFGSGNVAGFVPSALQASNSTYLSNAGQTVLPGYELTICTGGDFLCYNGGTTQCTRGMKAYANFATGVVTFAAAGAPTTSASATGSSIAAQTFSVTGSLAGNIMTVTAVGSGTIYPGATISGTNVASGSIVLNQLTGTTGGVGTYTVSIPEQTAASTTISGTYGLMTIGTLTTTPAFAVGQTLTVSGSVVAGTQITANVTGSGGSSGTMVVNNNTVVSSQTISSVGNVETPFYALNSALAGEVVKISAPVAGYGSQLA